MADEVLAQIDENVKKNKVMPTWGAPRFPVWLFAHTVEILRSYGFRSRVKMF
jgi:hypothetical protein